MEEPLYGVIDVGSNSIRLCVYRRDMGAPYPIKKVFDEKQTVGLASYVKNGAMTDDGIRAAAKAINRQLSHVSVLGLDQASVFATAALRNCSNSKDAVKKLEQRIATPVEVVTGPREAELGFFGIQPEQHIGDGVVVDIGGGSTEMTLVRKGKPKNSVSVPMGSLSAWNAYVSEVFPSEGELTRIREEFRARLANVGFAPVPPEMLYGLGGTIRAARKLYDVLFNEGVETGSVTRDQVELVIGVCLRDMGRFSHAVLSTEPSRVHTLVPGMALLLEVFRLTGAERIECSHRGVREGYVLSHMGI